MSVVVSRVLPSEPVADRDAHVARGGLTGLSWAVGAGPDAVIDRILEAGIRGRGGAGFPTGIKWRSIRDSLGVDDDLFVVVNAAEGEPGTYKDRTLLQRDPFVVLEGALIAATTLGADRLVVATKAKFTLVLARLRAAAGELADLAAANGIRIEIVEGPDHYLFGEETAMLEVIEGEDPLPRHLPPYQYGLFTTSPQLGWSAGSDASTSGPTVESHNPALVNNAETYAHVAMVCRNGVDWYRSLGTVDSPGPTIVTVSGDVRRPAVAEVELGVTLRSVIDEVGGGVEPGRSVKAVLSGVSNGVLTAADLETPLTYEALSAVGGGLGSAGFIVYDDRRNMVDVGARVSRFLHVESCGQCTPCKTGTLDITVALERLVRGTTDSAVVDAIVRRTRTVNDASRCYLATQEAVVVSSILRAFPEDLAERLSGIPGDLDVVLPVIASLEEGVLVVDEAAERKRPDWTVAETPVRLTVDRYG